jgi:aminoglycoside phosphotransferase family enzyme
MSQEDVVRALLKPDTYDEVVHEVALLQTHISFIFLTENYVYKVKKAVNFGFLDFTTLEKRRFYCQKELDINRRLCEDMYLEVVPINKSASIKVKGEGEAAEYAVKMRRIPQERMMSQLLEENKIDNSIIDRIARIIAEFHSEAEADVEIAEYGSLDVIGRNWDENFEQTKKYVDKTISAADYKFVQNKVSSFMSEKVSIFEKRLADGRIRDCHGDIHSGNIFVADKIYIFDAIEFNNRFRFSDVASDVAFLAMDLEYKGHNSLSEFFVERYVGYSGDQDLQKVLPFYKCYRAYVRGKVTSFKLDDSNIGVDEVDSALREARAYFELAVKYGKTF